ncbi:MAG: helix-turn-helix domain-containing protein [Candidatus Fimenecus sp.]
MIWNERIKELREDHDLTQKQMAKIIDTTQRAISYYENNQRMLPPEIIVKYSKFFKVSTDYILGIKER